MFWTFTESKPLCLGMQDGTILWFMKKFYWRHQPFYNTIQYNTDKGIVSIAQINPFTIQHNTIPIKRYCKYCRHQPFYNTTQYNTIPIKRCCNYRRHQSFLLHLCTSFFPPDDNIGIYYEQYMPN